MEDINVSINTGIDIFKANIANVISTSQLPVGIIYYVFKDILTEIKDLYNETVQEETQKLQEQIIQENKEEDVEDVKEEHQEN